MSATIAENLALLRQHIRALEERAEAAERGVEELTAARKILSADAARHRKENQSLQKEEANPPVLAA